MSLKILIADPDQSTLNTLKSFIDPEEYEVHGAINGKKAQLLLYQHDFFAIVLNLELKNHSGPQVFKFIRSKHPNVKVILTMSKKEILEETGFTPEHLAKFGINDHFVLPIDKSILIDAIEGKQDYNIIHNKAPKRNEASKEEELKGNDEGFTSVRINEFASGRAVQFDVFVKLSTGRYIKILHSGDAFSKERINKYKNEKKIEFLYFRNEDRKKFIRMTNFIATQTADNKKIKSDLKLKLVKNVAEKFAEEAYGEGVRPQVIEQGKQLMDTMYNVIHNNDDLHLLLRDYEDFDPSTFSHSYLVCLFSCMLVKQFDWESKIVNETIGMAALLHDIGKTKLSPEIRGLRPHQMNEEQIAEYQKHPMLGVELLRENPGVNSAVRQIVFQHHETLDGKGFPHKLKGHKILTLAKIISLCDEFVHIMEDEKIKPPEALKKLLNDTNITKKHHSLVLENFMKIFLDPKAK